MKHQHIIDQLTLAEKAGLCSGLDFWHLKGVERLGIPSIMVTDGPHGLRKQPGKGDHLGINKSIQSTCFPTAATTASSWDRDLLAQMGDAIAQEALSEQVSVVLGPGVNIKRSPLCGRNFEYFSEDPYLSGELAAAYINGVQEKGVGTSLKHFATNNQETRRNIVNTIADERTLREIYLTAFEKAVKQAQPWTVMSAYNLLNGTYCSEHKWLLDELLRGEWGFDGLVVTDWGAENDRIAGLEAGQELEMPACQGINDAKIVRAVEEGKLDEAVLNERVDKILDLILRAKETLDANQGATFSVQKHHALARKIAAQSMVLLKNEDHMLPLDTGDSIAVIGALARAPRYQGAGSSHINPTKLDNAFDCLIEAGANVSYAPGYFKTSDEPNNFLIHQACEVAKKAKNVVVFLGLTEDYESEGYDRQHMCLPYSQEKMLNAVVKVNPNVVVVLAGGSPVEMPWIGDVKAVLNSYLGGQAGGGAVADILLGKVNPSGKLAETYPLRIEDVPCYHCFPGIDRTVEYRESIFVGYRYYDKVQKDVLFPFGYGLSYTEFAYSSLKLSKREMDDSQELTVSFKVKNTGNVDGAEIAQVYVSDVESTVYKAPQELKGFTKVFLKAGEEKQVSVTLDRRAFAYFDEPSGEWNVEDGVYHILVAASSRDIRLKGSVKVHPVRQIACADQRAELPAYYTGDVQEVPDDQYEKLLGHLIPPHSREKDEKFDVNSTLDDAKDTKWGKKINAIIGKILPNLGTGLVGSEDMLESIFREMPIRGMMMMSRGVFDEKMCEGLLKILNDDEAGKGLGIILKQLAIQAKNIPDLISSI